MHLREGETCRVAVTCRARRLHFTQGGFRRQDTALIPIATAWRGIQLSLTRGASVALAIERLRAPLPLVPLFSADSEAFTELGEARFILQHRSHYNLVRPHSSLGYLTPSEFKITKQSTSTTTREAVL